MENQPQTMVLKSRRKWFWIGIALSITAAPFPGLIYGIALFLEREYRKEATIIIVVSIAWAFVFFFVSKWLVTAGYLPRFQIIR